MRDKLILFCLAAMGISACSNSIDNPYDDVNNNSGNTVQEEDTLDPSTFSYLHYKIFAPTCANSGCHDGTFEPDFTTIESSYNTLVYHPIIKNDQSGSYTYRVQPGNANASLLMERISGQMDGVEDQMPIVIDPGSDYAANRNTYIGRIRDWINTGAKDMFGNSPKQGNLAPQVVGVIAYADGGATPLDRENDLGAILVPSATTSLEIWVAVEDDSTAISNMGQNEIKFSTGINDFASANALVMNISASPVVEAGFTGSNVSYYHKITINPSQMQPNDGEYIYFRTYFDDNSGNQVEIPTQASFNYIKQYLSFIRTP